MDPPGVKLYRVTPLPPRSRHQDCKAYLTIPDSDCRVKRTRTQKLSLSFSGCGQAADSTRLVAVKAFEACVVLRKKHRKTVKNRKNPVVPKLKTTQEPGHGLRFSRTFVRMTYNKVSTCLFGILTGRKTLRKYHGLL